MALISEVWIRNTECVYTETEPTVVLWSKGAMVIYGCG